MRRATVRAEVSRVAIEATRAAVGKLALATAAVAFLGFGATAHADTTICPAGTKSGQCESPAGLATDFETGRLYVADGKNNRVDAFEADGSFAFAFGWGVADGEAQLESCGPAATPPTASCSEGLAGVGAGEFDFNGNGGGLQDIAVDNDPASASHHDVYVLERDNPSPGEDGGPRVQRFDSEGHFLLAFGGGVIGGGAAGSGNLSVGSTEVTAVTTTSKSFEAGQTIESPGKLAPGTKIVALGVGTITLSKPAIASGTAAPLSVAEGAGNVPTNETYLLVHNPTQAQGPPYIAFRTPNPSPSRAEDRQEVNGNYQYTLPANPTAAELQAAIEAFPNVGVGNVAVTNETVNGELHEYTVEFTGTRFADTDVRLESEGAVQQNGAGAAEICTVAIAKSCAGGVQGSGHGQFYANPHLAVGPGGVVYVADCVGNPNNRCQNRLQKFAPSGAFLEQIALPQSDGSPQSLAVNSSGDFYVSYNASILEYSSSGSVIGEPSVGKSPEVGALTLDPSGDLFAAETDSTSGTSSRVIAEYSPSGETLRRFGYDVVKVSFGGEGLAPDPGTEAVYSTESGGVISRDFPAAGPIVRSKPCASTFRGSGRATLLAEVNPEGKTTSFQFQYVDQKSFEEEGGFASKETKFTSPEPLGSDFFLHAAEALASPLAPETTYRCRVIATDSENRVSTGREGSFTTREPLELGATTVSGVGTEEATLKAEVNPLGIPTSGYFEYVEEATYLKDIEELGPGHGFDHAIKAPNVDQGEEPLDYGAGEELNTRSLTLKGLKLGTSYRFRIHATDPFLEGEGKPGIVGPAERFHTYGAPSEPLPDNRGFELVSPDLKNSADIFGPPNGRGFEEEGSVRIVAGSPSGNMVTYTAWTSFANAQSAPATSQYVSKRTESGWQTENVSPYGFQSNLLVPPYVGFSADLRYGTFKAGGPEEAPLAVGCPANHEAFYLRGEDDSLRCLSPEVPATTLGFNYCFTLGGISEDSSRVFFRTREAGYAGVPAGEGASLYESHEGAIHVVSILPGQTEPAPTTKETAFGTGSPAKCQTGQSILRHAISPDGNRAIWTYVAENESAPSRLLDRIEGTKTIQLDATKGGSSKTGGEGVFWAASKDGSLVYFTDEQRLAKGSKAQLREPDLYRYDLQTEELTDLTKPKAAEAANVQGVLGASEDGSKVYYVAQGVLTGEEEDEAGERAKAGADNLYLYDADAEKSAFIAQLSGEDDRDWDTRPKYVTARVSPDGEHLAFLSTEAKALAGYDNTLEPSAGRFEGGRHCQIEITDLTLLGSNLCQEAFLYDAESNTLTCASCNPSGTRPRGPATLPGWTSMIEGPHYLSDDGKRFFFESFDRLSSQDENNKRDVYEFELPGSGSCSRSSAAFDPTSGGCHYLLSSGRSTDEAHLMDASANGRDVFFSTRSALTGWDSNDNYDLYDAREGGGFAEPPAEPVCEGEAACKPPASMPPGFTPPPRFEGAGNPPAQKEKAKARHKKAHKHKKAKKRHSRHTHKREGTR